MTKKVMIVALACATAMSLVAVTESANGYTWTYQIKNGSAEISTGGYAGTAAISPKPTGAVSVPSTLGGYPVTSIGQSAFHDCSGMTEVSIPNSVKSIGRYAFFSCGLKTLTIPDSVTNVDNAAFTSLSCVTNVMIGNGVTTIGNWFPYTSSIVEVTLPASKAPQMSVFAPYSYNRTLKRATLTGSGTNVPARIFAGCGVLQQVILQSSATVVGEYALAGCAALESVRLPASLRNIGNYAFSGCSSLSSLSLPYGVVSIGEGAFNGCSGLTSVSLPSNLRTIGANAFAGCSRLPSISIPNKVDAIGDSAFAGCFALKKLVIPDSVRSIGRSLITGCSGLERITLPSIANAERVINILFGGLYSDKNPTNYTVVVSSKCRNIAQYSFEHVHGLVGLEIPQSVTNIGEYAFKDCYNLLSVSIPGSVVNVADGAFSGCRDLTSVVLAEGVRELGMKAFEGCGKLSSVEIPNSVCRIRQSAFSGCNDGLFNADARRLGLDIVGQWITGTYYWWNARYDITYPEDSNLLGIADGAFCGLNGSVHRIVIPNTVLYIGEDAFSSIKTLEEVAISDSVAFIGSNAFADCSNLECVFLEGNAPIMGTGVFRNVSADARAYVRQDSSIWDEVVAGMWSGLHVWRAGTYDVCIHSNNGKDEQYTTTYDCGNRYYVSSPWNNEGHSFSGWATNSQGLAIYSAGERVRDLAKAGTTVHLFDVWDLCQYTVTFDANGGEGGWSRSLEYDSTITAPIVTRPGYTFAGWSPEIDTTVPASNVTYVAQWQVNQYSVAFNANGGNGEMLATNLIYEVGYALPPNSFTNPGFTFVGWSFTPDGDVEYGNGAMVSNLTAVANGIIQFYAKWSVNQYTVMFNANGGIVSPESKMVTYDAAYGELPVPVCTEEGYAYTFDGWFTKVDGGELVTSETKVSIMDDQTLFAHWTVVQNSPPVSPEVPADREGPETTPTPTLLPEPIPPEIEIEPDVEPTPVLPVPVPADNAGTVSNPQFTAAQTMGGALFDANGLVGTVEVKLAKASKGEVKVSASAVLLSTGKKVAAKAVKMPVSNGVISGTLQFKDPIGDMAFSMNPDGTFTLENGKYSMSAANMSKTPSGKFRLDPSFSLSVPGELQTDLLPFEFGFTATAKKWTFPKNASVKVAKDKTTKEYGLVVDTSKGKTNLSSMKLTYKAKDGTFKGTFKAYAVETSGGKKKLKSYTINVTGVVIDGVGYGEATLKSPKAGPWKVVVE